MKTSLQVALEKFISENDNTDISLRSYSGRGMYGKECLGVDCNHTLRVIGEVLAYLATDSDDLHADIDALSNALCDAKTDNMGLGMILYFPSIPYVGEENACDEDQEDEDGGDNPLSWVTKG